MNTEHDEAILHRAQDLLERKDEVSRTEWRGLLAEMLVFIEEQATRLKYHRDAEAAQRLQDALEAVAWQDSQMRFSEELAGLGSWSYDLSTNEIWWSAELVRMFGFEEERQEIDFSEMLQRIHPNDRQPWLNAVETLMGEGKPYVMRLRALPGDGVVRPVVARGKADFGEDGGVWRIFGSMQREEAAKAGAEWSAESDAALIGTENGRSTEEAMAALEDSVVKELEEELEARIELSGEPLVVDGEQRRPIPRRGLPSSQNLFGVGHVPQEINVERQGALDLGYWELDLDSGSLRWSPHMFVLYGTDGRGLRPSLERMLSALPKADRRRFEELLHMSVQQRRGFVMQTRMVGDDGAHREILIAANLGGRPSKGLKLSGVVQDISTWPRRRKVQGALVN